MRQAGVRDIEVVRSGSKRIDLEITSNFLDTSLLKKIYKRIHTRGSDEAMFEYMANYTWGYRLEYKTIASKRIWFTGENLRPPIGMFNATFSFDKSDEVLSNVFFPYWLYRLDWGFGDNGFEIQVKPDKLSHKRAEEHRPMTVCSFSSTREPTREKLKYAVENVLKLDSFGKSTGLVVDSKSSVSRKYGFQICPENDIYPNYVTEKLIEAWACGNIPIWSGLDSDSIFNPDAYVNATGLTVEEIQERISNISQEEAIYMRSLPLIRKIPNLNEIVSTFAKII